MFTIQDHGSLVLVRPLDPDVTEWLTVNTDGTWWGGALAVESRFAYDLVLGMTEAGFTLKQEVSRA